MATSVKMPQLGETVIEGTILKWLKKEGEPIDVDEPLFEISTDKVDTEVPSPTAGTVTKILVPEGETVSVGTELAQITEVGSEAPNGEAAGSAEAASVASSDATAQTPEAPVDTSGTEAKDAVSLSGSASVASSRAGSPSRPAASAGPRSQILSPVVRKLAEEHDVDLSQVPGTGTGGRITRNDVLNFVDSGASSRTASSATGGATVSPSAGVAAGGVSGAAKGSDAAPLRPAELASAAPGAAPRAPTTATTGEREEVVPMSHIRKAIATHMVESLRTSARAWNMVEVDLEHVARLRERAKEAFRQREGINLTYMPFVSRAVCEALLTHPMVNSELRGEEIVVRRYVNLGIAVSIDDGLIVPVIKDADSMNLVGLARAINDVAVRARAKQLKPDEVHGGTFSITNPGPFGSILSVPIINQPQTAILAFDAVEKRAVVVDDAIAIRHRVYLSMSWDHRVIDGALASQFLGRLKQNLETWDFAEDLGV
ncbi:MAG: 2-oxo acid dehydrogenase subunit E2 [Actinomycetota bacterium]|nr:2-oxo acid dehydrogenase subunit E2 [Actinomycetota bacterium]